MKKIAFILALLVASPAIAAPVKLIDGAVSASYGITQSSLAAGVHSFVCYTSDPEIETTVVIQVADSPDHWEFLLTFNPSGVGPSGQMQRTEKDWKFYRANLVAISGPVSPISCEMDR